MRATPRQLIVRSCPAPQSEAIVCGERGDLMKKVILSVFAVPFILAPAAMLAQSGMKPAAATYISDEEVKAVNALPGVDRTIRVVDIGPENFAVGIVHRGATGAARGAGAGAAAGAARGGAAGAGAGAAAGAGRGAAAASEPCG